MKKYLSKICPALVISLVMGFMFFIYESITLFSTTTEDFWFGLWVLVKANLIYLFLFVVLAVLFSSLILLISNKLKKDKIYTYYLLTFNVLFVTMYIQGNFLSGSLPVLDGSPIEWNSYTLQSIISIVLLLIVIGVNIYLLKKYKDYYKRIISYVACAIFAMLSVSLITTLTTNNEIYAKKGVYVATTKNINVLSTNKNYSIFLIDMLDSKTFDEVLKKDNKEYLFKDFTYYPDTLSAYPFTRESIPYVLSGEWYEAKTPFPTYYTNAMTNSKFLETLKEKEYDVNIYEVDLQWNNSKSLEVNNIEAFDFYIDRKCLFRQETKYLAFKYFPFSLKSLSRIETLDYNLCRNGSGDDLSSIYTQENEDVYEFLGDITLQDKNYFQFIHINGGHYPWNMNKDFEIIENGTYEDKIESAITVFEKYIDRIKASGQYDNTVIIVLADHGNNGYDVVGRQNPSLYIKGFNETHKKMIVSDKKVSYEDLNSSIYYDLLDGLQSTELLKDIDDNRVRRFIWYKDYDDMYEQTLDGHAWETDKLKNTGNRYKR